MPKTISKLSQLTPDKRNANRGTKRGAEALDHSITSLGTGRSILIDADGNVIAGNKTLEAAKRAGLKAVRVIQTDGKELIAVQRTDLNLETDTKAKELAIADNRTGELSLDWDPAVLKELDAELNLEPFFDTHELDAILGHVGAENDPAAEYEGMPDFTSEDQEAHRQILVSFKSAADAEAFAKLVGYPKFTDKTRSIWYPHVEWIDAKSYAYKPQEDGNAASVSDLHPDV